MISNFKFQISNSQKGITLIELIVVMFLIVVFSMIVISDFPKIMRQHALSRATYKLAQDLRKTEDMGLSGVTIYDNNKDIILAKGYGVYFNMAQQKQYIIYADVPGEPDENGVRTSDQKYTGTGIICSDVKQDELDNEILTEDCVLEVIDISKENSSLFIENIGGYASVSINFVPPNPDVTIITDETSSPEISISLSNGLSIREVLVNKAGLINVQ